MSKLTSIAKDLLIIDEDLHWRNRDAKHNPISQDFYDMHIFEQWWPDTSCGFGGIAGQAFTQCNVYVLVPKTETNYVNVELPTEAIVYIGNRFAYKVPVTKCLLDDIAAHNMRPVYDHRAYL